MGEIRFVGTGETRGYPYLVCKKTTVYWLATSCGRFFFFFFFFYFVTICFLVTDIIVLIDSIFWLNKLGVNCSIVLIYFFLNTLKCVPVTEP